MATVSSRVRTGIRGLIGDRAFYQKVFLIVLPIMVQNGITNFVGMLDNIMVGQVGTEQMSGVAIVNQLLTVFNISIFGIVAGAGILGAQFYGSGNQDGIRYTLRFKLVCCVGLTAVFTVGMLFLGSDLIGAFLHEGGTAGDLPSTLAAGEDYLRVMFAGLLPFALTQAYAGTLRETGQTMVPMVGGSVAVLVNLCFNYILIFGHFGAPALGVVGAAIATVLSRYVELLIVVIWAHRHGDRHPFIVGLYRHFSIPYPLVKKITRLGLPLFINEVMWSVGMALMGQCYSVRGLDVVAAMNISNTITNLFNVVFMSLGNAVGIIVGQLLGSGDLKRAKEEDRQLIAFTVFCCVITGTILFLIAPYFPRIYNTDPAIRAMATRFIQICGLCTPLFGFVNATYFTLRAGGRTVITFLFDSLYIWVVTIPLVFILCRRTALPVVLVYLIDHMTDILKCALGFILVKKGVWLQNIVSEPKGADELSGPRKLDGAK